VINKMKNEKKENIVGLAVRVSARAPFGSKASHKLLPSEIVNLHWGVYEKFGMVAYGTNVKINPNKKDRIDKIFLFGNSNDELFLCICDVVKIFISDDECRPNIESKYLVPEWNKENKKTWLMIKNFRQLDIDTCEYKLLNESKYLREQILKPRFNSCYVNIEN
ncbi:MAG: hypothetical protein KZY55_08285, partial [Paeniclostridium sp.]